MMALRVTALLVAVAVAYAALGFFSVGTDESAVTWIWGRPGPEDVRAGVHWHPPPPIGRVVVAKTATNWVMPVGYRLRPGARPPVSDLWLSGDTNLVSARLDIQYTIDSLTDFVTRHAEPRTLIRRAGERAACHFLAGAAIDEIITSGRERLRRAARDSIQSWLTALGAGVSVQDVAIRLMVPPDAGGVRDAFEAVQDARTARSRHVSEAEAYALATAAQTQGEVEQIESEARAAHHRRVVVAESDGQRFVALAAEHRRAPGLTRQRLYLETLERILPGMTTYVVEPGQGGQVRLRLER